MQNTSLETIIERLIGGVQREEEADMNSQQPLLGEETGQQESRNEPESRN